MRKTRNGKQQQPLHAVESGGKTTGRGGQGGRSNKNKFAVFEFVEDDELTEADSHRTIYKFESKTRSRKSAHHPVDKNDFLSCFTQRTPISRLNSGTKPSIVDVSDDCLEDETFDVSEKVVVVTPNYVKYRGKSYTKCSLEFSQRCIKLTGSFLHKEKSHHCLEWSMDDIMKIECHPLESVEADSVNFQFKSMDANVSGACNLTSDADIMELEFVVLGDSQWPKKIEEIKSLDPKYESAWETIPPVNSSDMAFEDVIYPKGDPDAVCISKKDVDLLQPRTFINDTVIDFYIKYLLNKMESVEQHQFHAFNAFFFRKLADLDQDLSKAWDGERAFQRVRKWTRNVNLFEKDYILIPVNFSFHWSLIVICHPGKVTNFEEKDLDNSPELPCILHMDSFHGSHRGFENLIQSYLLEEWKVRNNELDDDVAVKFLNLPFVVLQLPQQENCFDCGLFLLHYAELFLQLASNFGLRKYADLLNEDLFLPAEVSLKKRDHIRNLIYRIVGEEVGKEPPAVCSSICLPGDHANKGDNSVEFVKETHVDMCCGKKFNSSVDQQIHMLSSSICRQKPFVGLSEPSHFAESASNECFNLFQPMVSIQEEAREKPKTFWPPFTASSREAGSNSVSFPSPYPVKHLETSETDVQCRVGATSAMTPIIIGEHNGEDCDLDVESNTGNEESESDCTSPSSDVLAACVADSEEEDETQIISRRHWRSTLSHPLYSADKQPNFTSWYGSSRSSSPSHRKKKF